MANNSNFIGKYRILEEIASGAFGRVFRGEHTSNRVVAVKVLHTAHLGSSQERNGFLKEAQLLTMLKHPFILPVLDVGIDNGLPYLVTEYAPNGSLQNRLKKQSPRLLKIQESLIILAQIGEALQYAHQQNVIHRDLKPENILFNAHGEVLLADFGIATMLASSMKQGTAVGTPFYMAPEQFRGSSSKEGDQYALGCIAYELFTGRVPFTAPDFFALGYKHMSEMPMLPSQLNLLVPLTIEQAILKALAKQRTDRHSDIAAFMQALGVPQVTQAQSYDNATGRNIDEDSTFIRASSAEQQPASIYHSVATSPTSLTPFPAPGPFTQEETGKVPIVGQIDTPFAPSLGALRTLDNEEVGKVFHPAASLPRVLESSSFDTPIPPNTGRRMPTNFAEEGVSRSGIAEVPSRRHMSSEEPGRIYTQSDYAAAHTFDAGLPNPITGTHRNAQHSRIMRKRNVWLISATLPLLLLFISGGVLYAMSSMSSNHKTIIHPPTVVASVPTATVTITPTHKNLSNTYIITAVTGNPVASHQQVEARFLSFSTPWQSQTVSATGKGTISATYATGAVTLFSNQSYPQTVAAGTPIPNRNNVVVAVTLATVTVPPSSNSNTWGVVNVAVRATQVGTAGNIPPSSIYDNCCTSTGWIYAINGGAISGGQNAQNYTYVQISDINSAVSVANQMKTSLTSSAQASLQSQIRSNEMLVGPMQCTSKATYNHKAGDHATSVTIAIMVTCTGEVYDHQGAQSMGANLLTQKITTAPSFSYKFVSKTTTSVTQAKVVDARGTISLLVTTTTTGVFQFSDAQKQELASLIVGKSELDAQTLLMNQAGISQVLIQVSGGDGNTLPTNPSRITVDVLSQA